MKENRCIENIYGLTNGPGRLAKALRIDNGSNGVSITSAESEIFVANNETKFEIGSSQRMGVGRDLERKQRFFIKGNRFVSKR